MNDGAARLPRSANRQLLEWLIGASRGLQPEKLGKWLRDLECEVGDDALRTALGACRARVDGRRAQRMFLH